MENTERVARPGHVDAARYLEFDVYAPLTSGKDFHESWKALQDADLPDIVWTPYNGGHWMVLRGRLVQEVLSDYKRFSNHTVLVPKETAGEAYRLLPLSLDPPAHAPFRNLLSKGLSPKLVRSAESEIRKLTIDMIEKLQPKGNCNFTVDFAEQLPIRIFMQIVDLPESDTPKLKHLADQFTRPDGSLTYPEVGALFREYVNPIIAGRRGGTGEDMITQMVNGTVDGRSLNDEEAANLCIQVLVGGLDTVVNFMSFVMLFLAKNPAARRELRDAPEKLPVAIMELARRFPLVTVGREVREDIEYEGVSLKRGEMVVAPTLLHGLDDNENPDPMSVDFYRKDVRHSTFGAGSHACPGIHLARSEVRILLEEWLARIPEFDVDPRADIGYVGGIVGSVNGLPSVWQVD